MKWLALIAATIVSSIVLYSVAYPTTTYRFRITLNVDTPQGLKSGSSVMEVRHRTYPAWTTLGNNTGDSKLTGEAVFVDLGPGDDGKPRNVIALLAFGPHAEMVDFYLLPTMAFESHWRQRPKQLRPAQEISKLPIGTRTELRGGRVPTLVSFTDVNNPNSVRVVPVDDFPRTFGANVLLHSAEIETVSSGTWPLTWFGIGGEPITTGIEKRLPWIATLIASGRGGRIDGHPGKFTINVPYFTTSAISNELFRAFPAMDRDHGSDRRT